MRAAVLCVSAALVAAGGILLANLVLGASLDSASGGVTAAQLV